MQWCGGRWQSFRVYSSQHDPWNRRRLWQLVLYSRGSAFGRRQRWLGRRELAAGNPFILGIGFDTGYQQHGKYGHILQFPAINGFIFYHSNIRKASRWGALLFLWGRAFLRNEAGAVSKILWPAIWLGLIGLRACVLDCGPKPRGIFQSGFRARPQLF